MVVSHNQHNAPIAEAGPLDLPAQLVGSTRTDGHGCIAVKSDFSTENIGNVLVRKQSNQCVNVDETLSVKMLLMMSSLLKCSSVIFLAWFPWMLKQPKTTSNFVSACPHFFCPRISWAGCSYKHLCAWAFWSALQSKTRRPEQSRPANMYRLVASPKVNCAHVNE